MELAADAGLSLEVFRFFLKPFSRACFAGKKNAFVICSDGSIRKCSHRIDDNKNFLGNVTESFDLEKLESKKCEYEIKNMEINPKCIECKKLPLCFGLVCPAYEGDILDTCGYDLSNIERLLRILITSNEKEIEEVEI